MDINEWRSAIADMKKNSNSKIVDKLIISYNRLEQTQQRMFLDLACFFRGKERDEIKPVLESCDFDVDFGLRILIDRSLVFVLHEDTIEMHDLIQEMGLYVVNMRREPGERSRLWLKEDIVEVLKNNTGTKAVEAICLDWYVYEEGIYFSNEDAPISLSLSNEAFINMRSLRIFQMAGGGTQDGSIIGCLPNSLRWFVWNSYPWESLPETFEPKKLAYLDLSQSKLRFLWTGTKDLCYLRTLNLQWSKRLKQTPDFTGMPNLEYLNLEGCVELEEISPSLGCCRKLIKLILCWCHNLERLPEEIGDLENLEWLDARWTANLPLPSSIVRLNNLKFLSFANVEPNVSVLNFVFPSVGAGLRSLEYLDLAGCILIDGELPEDIGCLSSLKELHLAVNMFEHLPRSIGQLGALQVLNLGRCKWLKELPELPPELEELTATSDVILKEIHSLVTKKKLLKLLIDDDHVDNDSIYNSLAHSLHQNFSSKQQDISASDSLSQRVFSIFPYGRPWLGEPTPQIPSWFHYQGNHTSVSTIDLPKNWYIHDNFLSFVVFYKGISVETAVHLIPLCNDVEMSWMTEKLALHNYSKHDTHGDDAAHFFFVPLAGLWDTSKANGKTPNDYGHIRLEFSRWTNYGLRLLNKNELEGGSLLHMKENNDELTELCIGIRRSRHENDGEASCSTIKKQRGHSYIHCSSVVMEEPVSPETLQLFPANTGFESEDNAELERESLLQMKENNDELTELCIGIRRSWYENNELDGEASCSNFKKQR